MATEYWWMIGIIALMNFPLVAAVDWYARNRSVKFVYTVAVPDGQVRREFKNSLVTTPVHALLLYGFLVSGLLKPGLETPVTIGITFLITFVWTEIWHYASHVAMHTRPLLFIHREHHLSKLTEPWTSVSFSFLEKFIFSLGIIGFMAALSNVAPVSALGIGAYYVLYFVTNTLGHANFEFRKPRYGETVMGRIFNSPAYHAMHHARFINNYSLMTPFLDNLFGTRWTDAGDVQTRAAEGQPLTRLGERCGPRGGGRA